ncbi:VOC family protein [Pseudoalteromonas sp. MMG010]|uniref:VOC family protein n=1 Tax=Pseudoalteromonas sp. MMG010 TaxID=2822685 RepID=UPI001B3A42C6|nr:VOC family protein [Pseudoalteromonas sp. MMG010]MBQ4834211.1 VOC family protein [Pseudoalteromonas sp. MMG010]
MSNINKYQQGQFCWAELCTSHWAKAKTFYTGVFQWGHDDQPIAEDAYYTMFNKQGDNIAAMYQMPKEQLAQGAASHWLAYIAVDDIDACAQKVKALGGQLIVGPHQVMNAGKMLLLQDPSGSVVALWQAIEHPGCKRQNEFNVPYWHELATRNTVSCRDFYCQLLGWQYEIKPMEGIDYTLFLLAGKPVAGMIEMDEQWPEDTPPHWMVYFAVLHCDSTTEQVKQLGGEVCVVPTDIPDVGRFSVLTDPQGAVFSILESAFDDVSCDQ